MRAQRGKACIRIAGASSTWQLRGGVVSCNLTRQLRRAVVTGTNRLAEARGEVLNFTCLSHAATKVE